VLAFMKVNGVPFHFFILNIIQTFRRPRLRVWDKSLTDDEVKAFMTQEKPPVPPAVIRKAPAATSRLHELSLVINTGGVYQPEEGEE